MLSKSASQFFKQSAGNS